MWDYQMYLSFIQLRKQYYKLKTTKQIDKYSNIEYYSKDYKTFKRFCDSINNFYYSLWYEEIPTVDDVFNRFLELSKKRQLKNIIF